jgi:hypothetical protein
VLLIYITTTFTYHCLLDNPSFPPKHGLSVRCLKYAFLKAGFNSADVGGLGSFAQTADAAYVSIMGYLCTRIVPVTSNEIARTFVNVVNFDILSTSLRVDRFNMIFRYREVQTKVLHILRVQLLSEANEMPGMNDSKALMETDRSTAKVKNDDSLGMG